MTPCTCRADLEAKLTDRFKQNTPDATSHKVELQGYAIAVMGDSVGGDKWVMRPYMPYKASAVHTLKKGGTKAKSETGNMMFSFCPFCGVKLGSEAV